MYRPHEWKGTIDGGGGGGFAVRPEGVKLSVYQASKNKT